MLAETYSIGILTSLQYIVSCFIICLKIILIDDSDVTGLQGYRVLQIRDTPVDYPIITLLQYIYAITEEHKIKYCCFTLEKVTRIHLEGGSYHTSWTNITISIFFIFRRENIFHLINRKLKTPIYCKQQYNILEITYL